MSPEEITEWVDAFAGLSGPAVMGLVWFAVWKGWLVTAHTVKAMARGREAEIAALKRENKNLLESRIWWKEQAVDAIATWMKVVGNAAER